MAFITEKQLSSTLDLPISLASTDLSMGDWIAVASVKLISPCKLTYRLANLQLSSSSVNTSYITSGNKIYGNLGFAYLILIKDYSSGSPGATGGLDTLVSTSLGIVSRSTSTALTITDAGVYTWFVCNNMQASTDDDPLIPITTSIDFRLSVTGSVRLELNDA